MSTDSNVLSFLREKGLQCLEKSLKFQIFICWPCFFNPKFKSSKSPDLTNDDRKRIHDLARLLMSEIVLPPSVVHSGKKHSYGQPSKKFKAAAFEDEIFDWQCDNDEIAKKKMKLASTGI